MASIYTKISISNRFYKGISERLLPQGQIQISRLSTTERADEKNKVTQANQTQQQPKELQTTGQAPLTLIPGDELRTWLDERQVRISKPTKNVMQSGTASTNTWKIEFMNLPKSRWENWLMGWTSTADPLSNMSLNFPTKEQAIAFCEKNNLPWFLDEASERKIRKKSYSDNFSYNKRTRLSHCRY